MCANTSIDTNGVSTTLALWTAVPPLSGFRGEILTRRAAGRTSTTPARYGRISTPIFIGCDGIGSRSCLKTHSPSSASCATASSAAAAWSALTVLAPSPAPALPLLLLPLFVNASETPVWPPPPPPSPPSVSSSFDCRWPHLKLWSVCALGLRYAERALTSNALP